MLSPQEFSPLIQWGPRRPTCPREFFRFFPRFHSHAWCPTLTRYNITSGEMPVGQPTLYEYFWDGEQTKWVPWTQKIPEYVHAPERKFNEILVPTVDTVRTMWLLSLQVRIKRPVLLIGETGTSKTATTSNFLRQMDGDNHVSYHCWLANFWYRTNLSLLLSWFA